MERQNKLAWITGAGGLIGNYLVQTAPRFLRVTCYKFFLAKPEFRRKILA
jgi:hypothetical protein